MLLKSQNSDHERLLVAMSGGVDSSVAACLLREEGYDLVGATMRLCPVDDKTALEDAAKAAERLSMEFHICDYKEDFRREVIDPFISAYEHGETPNPCIECNRHLKFGRLLEFGETLGIRRAATGHYARIEKDVNRFLLRKAADFTKDQSYVLYTLTQEQLARTIFPLGGLTKEEARRLAEAYGLANAKRKESQDICFIPDGDYAGFIKRESGLTYPPGDFVDTEGNILGTHRGVIHYTVGQRKGLGLALKQPMYVKEIDTDGNRVVLAVHEELFRTELTARDVNWIAVEPPHGDLRVKARIRYKHKEAPATVIPLGENRIAICFDEPQRAVTPGQSVILYEDDYVVGGGVIEHSDR